MTITFIDGYYLAEMRVAHGRLLLAEGRTHAEAIHAMVLLFGHNKNQLHSTSR